MSAPIYLQIPETCHQDWDTMSQQAQGRFCGSCQKTVVDFTTMSDQQVLNYFKDRSGNDTCGRFTDDQLNQAYQEPPKPKFGWYKWIAAFAASGMFGSLKVQAQAKTDTARQSCTRKMTTKGEVKLAMPIVMPEEKEARIRLGGISAIRPRETPVVIESQIIDQKQKPLPFSSILVKGTKRGVAADENGRFKLVLKTDWQDSRLVISSVGYAVREIALAPGSIQSINLAGDTINMQLHPILLERDISSMLSGTLGGVIVTRKVTRKDTLTTIARKVFAAAAFKASPNPVKAGGTLQLSFRSAGTWYIELLDIKSRLVSRLTTNAEGKNNPVYFPIPQTAVPGTYYVRIQNQQDKKRDVQKILVY